MDTSFIEYQLITNSIQKFGLSIWKNTVVTSSKENPGINPGVDLFSFMKFVFNGLVTH